MSANTQIQWTGRRLGRYKQVAARLGLSLDQYAARVDAGEKWCTGCKSWHPVDSFAVDGSRFDGRAARCRESVNSTARSRYLPKPPRGRRGFQAPTRDGDKLQARRRVNYLVEQGLIPHPNDLPCLDCGDEVFPGGPRHEYDHARGYDGENQLYVEPVCTRCHHSREEARRGITA